VALAPVRKKLMLPAALAPQLYQYMSVGARVAGALGRVGATSCYGLGSPLKDAAPSSSGSLKRCGSFQLRLRHNDAAPTSSESVK
jgi:hypothetical protein